MCRELKAQFDDGIVGIAVCDLLTARGSHEIQVAYPHKGKEEICEREAEE